MSKPLFDASDESENDNDIQLGTNQEYAKAFNSFRKKELLKKLKDRGYNNVSGSDSSEDSESSDEDDGNLDESFDRQFFKTLASLKSRDPTIYDKNTQFFPNNRDDDEAETGVNGKASKSISKPVTLKDYERKVIVEHGGRFEDDSEAESDNETVNRPASPTVVEEERRLKAEFRQVLEADDSADEEFGGIFSKRVKSKDEKSQEETDFSEWLAGKKAEIEASAKEKLEPLKNYWSQRNLPQSERFLRDYILNKGYSNTKSADIPTYAEIVGDEDGDAPQKLSDDERELEKQAEFEEKYNFRFEEPDTDFIKRYPRTIESSVRLEDGKRKEKRQELKVRKLAEKEQKMKEIEMLKEMKRKEIEEKIEKLKKVTGNDELGFKDDELEEDFDPEAHDKRMRELFNDEYYEVDEGEEKPECPSDIDELKVEDWDNYDPQRADAGGFDYNEGHCEDEDFNMDCDYDPAAAKQQFQQELIDNTKKRKNRRGRRNRFMEMIQQEKPAFDPEDERTYGDYIDEYYQMDCEDIIADIPCRFKYVETAPNDFGLTIEEILLAKNKELNQWASLKKALQIRPDQVEKRDQRLYKMKAKNEALKRKIFKSLYGEGSDDDNESAAETENATQSAVSPEANKDSQANTTDQNTKKKKSKKKRKTQQNIGTVSNAATKNESTEKTLAPAVKKEETVSHKEVAGVGQEQAQPSNTSAASAPDPNTQKKKRKNKRKNKRSNGTASTAVAPNNEPAAKKLKFAVENANEVKATESTAAITVPSDKKKKKKKKAKTGGELANNVSKPASEPKQKTETTTSNSNASENTTPAKPKNPFESTTTDNAPTNNSKENPFKAASKEGQPLFANEKVNGRSKFNNKSKPKFKPSNNKQRRKPFGGGGGGRTTGAGQVKINDERLKAYNINPRKFHKKQKFGGKKNAK